MFPDARPELPIGTVLKPEPYRIVQKIGDGPYSVVYLADDLDRGTRVVLKRLRGQNSPELMKRFEREARIMKKVVHRNIVQLLGYFILKDFGHFIVMEYIKGERLDAFVERVCPLGKQLPLKLILHIMENLLEALEVIHDNNFVHRDIKPQNIMLIARSDRLPDVRLMDFGVAKVLGGNAPGTYPGLTSRNIQFGNLFPIGSAEFMAPEQIETQDHEGVLPTTDIYAMGVLLFYLLTGVPPFVADEGDVNGCNIMAKHVKNDPPNIRILRDDIPEGLAGSLEKAMDKRQARRFWNAKEFLSAIREITGPLLPVIVAEPRTLRGFQIPRPRTDSVAPTGSVTQRPMPFRKP